MSFQLVGPYVETFAQRNPGSTAFMERGSDNRIQRVFVCPSFANDVVMCVRPVISIDGAHMRSEWKETLYLATVKSAGDDLYPVAFAITVDGEDFQGWLWFLQHQKASAPNLIAEHLRRECSYKLFTFMSDRCKGLTLRSAMFSLPTTTVTRKWQAIGVPCVHGMAYFRHQMKWRLEDVLDQAVDEYHKYRTQRELYRRNFVPVWRHLLEPDMMTLPPDAAARRMPVDRKR